MDHTPTPACVKDSLVIHFPLLRQIIMALVTAFTIHLTIKRLLELHPHSLHELLMTYGNFLFYTFAYFYSSPTILQFAWYIFLLFLSSLLFSSLSIDASPVENDHFTPPPPSSSSTYSFCLSHFYFPLSYLPTPTNFQYLRVHCITCGLLSIETLIQHYSCFSFFLFYHHLTIREAKHPRLCRIS